MTEVSEERTVTPTKNRISRQGFLFNTQRSRCVGPRMRDVCKLVLVSVVVLFPTGAIAQLVKCRLPNGSLYIGSAPPPDCGPVSDIRERGPVDSSDASGRRQPKPTPTPQRER
jgi:hypothetical protein